MPTLFSRRNLLLGGSAFGASLALPGRAHAQDASERFLLTILVPGGLDGTMMFDARPKAMTAAGKIHNPLNEEPTPWVGTNGVTTLHASTASALRAVRDRFSVINGVMMSPAFDGHSENMNLLLTGHPLGFESSFNAQVNSDGKRPLDYLRVGELLADTADSRFVELTPQAARQLAADAAGLSRLVPSFDGHVEQQLARAAVGGDRFATGVRALAAATTQSKTVTARMQSLMLPELPDELESTLSFVSEIFRKGLARGAMFTPERARTQAFDTHAPAQAKDQKRIYEPLCSELARVFAYFAATPFDAQRSMLDVTTLVVASEFGRTMRQVGAPIDATGTNHNSRSTTVLLGGAGVRGGQVIGASDFQTGDETLSGAHVEIDPLKICLVGRPFDFGLGVARSDLPAKYLASDYLQIGSVVNTIYALFGVERGLWRKSGDQAAPVIGGMLRV